MFARTRSSFAARALQLAAAVTLFAGPGVASAAETPDDERAILAYHDQGADAQPVLARTVADGSDNPRVHLYLALAERDRGELARAINILECALANPGDLERELRLELAVTASWQGSLKDAEAHYDEVLARWPEDAVARVGRARMLSWQGRHAKARTALQDILAENPKNLEAWSTLASTEAADFRTRAARDAYAELLELDPDNEDAARGLRSLNASRRFRLSAFGGYVNVDGEQHAGVGETDIAFDVRAYLTALAGYSASVYRFDDPTTFGHMSQQHAAHAALVFNIRRRVYLGSQYRVLVAADAVHHSVAISGAVVVTPKATISASVRPGLWSAGNLDVLTRLSLEGQLGRRFFPAVHWYAYRDRTRNLSNHAVVGKLRADIIKPLSVTVGGGWQFDGTIHGALALGELEVRPSDRFGIFARYELSTGLITRHAPGVGVRVRW